MPAQSESNTKQSTRVLSWIVGSAIATICAAFSTTVLGFVMDPVGKTLVQVPIAGRFFQNLCYEVRAQCGLPEKTRPVVQSTTLLPEPLVVSPPVPLAPPAPVQKDQSATLLPEPLVVSPPVPLAPPAPVQEEQTESSSRVSQPTTPDTAEAFFQEGTTRLASGDQKGAVESWNKALNLDPKNSEVYLALGQLRLEQGKPDKAGNNFKDALKYTNSKGKVALKIADLYYKVPYMGGDHAKAVNSLYTMAIREMPNCSLCFVRRGYFRAQFGQTEADRKEALVDMDRAVRADPNLAEAYLERAEWNLSTSMYSSRNIPTRSKSEILADYEKALELFTGKGETDRLGQIKAQVAFLKDAIYR